MSSSPPDTPSDDRIPPRTKTGEIIREAKGFGKWLSGLSTAQFQSFALVIMTGFMCALAGWLVYRWDISNQTDKTRTDRQLEFVMRENNSQNELVRQHCASETEKSRARFEAFTKEIQVTALAHMAAERAKDREHELTRDKEHSRQMQGIQNAWTVFSTKFADLERLIRGKKPDGDAVIQMGASIALGCRAAATNGP